MKTNSKISNKNTNKTKTVKNHVVKNVTRVAIAGWEARAGIRATAINNVIVIIDPQTEKMLSTMASINSVPVSAPAPQGNAVWQCVCGNNNSGKFCTECGTKKPEDWVCSCGNTNKGKFCTECGKPKNN